MWRYRNALGRIRSLGVNVEKMLGLLSAQPWLDSVMVNVAAPEGSHPNALARPSGKQADCERLVRKQDINQQDITSSSSLS